MRHALAKLALLASTLAGCSTPKDRPAAGAPDADEPTILSFELARIDGTRERLDSYKGRVVLVVNVASECGLTPQYEGIESLYRRLKDRGFTVLGFPANNFGGQEPGSNEQIAHFCASTFDVSFPMFEKISVAGEDAHPLYRELARVGGEPNWNFTKYLVDRSGRVVERFDPRTTPDDPKFLERIEDLLRS